MYPTCSQAKDASGSNPISHLPRDKLQFARRDYKRTLLCLIHPIARYHEMQLERMEDIFQTWY